MEHPLRTYDVSKREHLERASREVRLNTVELFEFARSECSDSGLRDPARALTLLCHRSDAATTEAAIGWLNFDDPIDRRVGVEYFLGVREVSQGAWRRVDRRIDQLLDGEDGRVVDRALVLASTLREPGEMCRLLRLSASSPHEEVRARVAAEILDACTAVGGPSATDQELLIGLAEDEAASVRATVFHEAAACYASALSSAQVETLVTLARSECAGAGRDAAAVFLRAVSAWRARREHGTGEELGFVEPGRRRSGRRILSAVGCSRWSQHIGKLCSVTIVSITAFLDDHPVFTRDEFVDAHRRASGYTGRRAAGALLQYHVDQGHLVRVRRGLYAVVPRGDDPQTHRPDRYLVASRLADDAVLAYHTALEVHGVAQSLMSRVTVCTQADLRTQDFRGTTFVAVRPRKTLRDPDQHVITVNRQGLDVRVTDLERTVVDVLDRLDVAGGWDEVMRSLAHVRTLDAPAAASYALQLGVGATAAKLGLYLHSRQEELFVDDATLARLTAALPKRPQRVERDTPGPFRVVDRWKLSIPAVHYDPAWAELS